jgi:hypothetical protein
VDVAPEGGCWGCWQRERGGGRRARNQSFTVIAVDSTSLASPVELRTHAQHQTGLEI